MEPTADDLAAQLIGYLSEGIVLPDQIQNDLVEGIRGWPGMCGGGTGTFDPAPQIHPLDPKHPVNQPLSPHFNPRMLGLPVSDPNHPFNDPSSAYFGHPAANGRRPIIAPVFAAS